MAWAIRITVLFALFSFPATAADNPQPPGGGDPSCRYCKYNVLSKNYSCPSSTNLTSRQGDCTITYHMGEYICRGPTGPFCIGGQPLPPSPALL